MSQPPVSRPAVDTGCTRHDEINAIWRVGRGRWIDAHGARIATGLMSPRHASLSERRATLIPRRPRDTGSSFLCTSVRELS